MLSAIAVAQQIPSSLHACLTVQAWTAGCNLRLVKALAQGLPILYNHVVKEVKYEQAGVSVTAGNTVIKGNISGPSLCKSVSQPLNAFCIPQGSLRMLLASVCKTPK